MTVAVKFARVDAAVEVFASWMRVIEGAPIENRPKLLTLMARDARDWAESQRQQAMQDLYCVAEQIGCVTLLGATHIRGIIADAFGGAE
jgi:tRNA/tmRNA/rRNA uracil-C5-methylase (TrmA/RlmC/RlmD family)